jgi:hypothetical protein
VHKLWLMHHNHTHFESFIHNDIMQYFKYSLKNKSKSALKYELMC